MSYPKSKQEWWKFVDDNWDDLKEIVLSYYPNQKQFPAEGWNPTNRSENLCYSPQAACNKVISELRKEKPIWNNTDLFIKYIEGLRKDRNKKLWEIFNDAWFGMPESPWVRSIPGFYIFCDLCSEGYLLIEKEA